MQPNNLSPRERTIPWGECVGEGQHAEVFRRIDAGMATRNLLELGKAACATCSQVCALFRPEIGTQMYDIGQSNLFIAGEEVVLPSQAKRTTILPAPVDFNLTKLPANPDLAADFIRQAVRIHPFGKGVRTAKTKQSIEIVAASYMAQLPEADERLFAKLLNPPRMKPQAVEEGLEKAAQILFQIADYDRFTAETAFKRKNPDRYSLEVVTPAWDNIITVFMRGMIELDQLRFHKPQVKTFRFRAETYVRLRKYYRETYGVSESVFNTAVDHNVAEPEKHLQDSRLRQTFLLDVHGPDAVQPSRLSERARWSLSDRPEDRVPDVRRKESVRRLRAAEIKALVANADATGYLPDPETPEGVAVAIMREFGEDPAFTPSAVTALTHLPLPEAMRRAAERQAYIKEILSNLGEDSGIAPSFIRYFVVSRGCRPIEEIKKHSLVHYFVDRFGDHSRSKGIKNPVPTWAIWRLLALEKDEAKIEKMGWQMYELAAQKLLVKGVSEPDVLQDMNFLSEVTSICEPRTGRYMTFNPIFNKLTAVDRIAFACHFGLSKVLYGYELDAREVAATLKIKNLSKYVSKEVLPKCEGLLQQTEPDEQSLPPTLAQLSDDMRFLQTSNVSSQPTLTIADTPSFQQSQRTVIGGKLIVIGPEGIKLAGLESTMRTWLRQLIYERCRPDHHDIGTAVERAILQGALEITGNVETGYNIDFMTAWRQNYSESEIAAAAQILGIDRFMYGHDLKELLKERLELSTEIIAQPLLDALRDMAANRPKLEKPNLEMSYFGKIGRPQTEWLIRGLVESEDDSNKQSIATKAAHLKKALIRGDLEVVETDTGFVLHVPDRIINSNPPTAIRQVVEACGVMHMLGDATRQRIETHIEAHEYQRKRQAEDRRIELGMAILLDIYIHYIPSLTAAKKSQITGLVAAHLSQTSAEPVLKDDWEKQTMNTVLARMTLDYQHYARVRNRDDLLVPQVLGIDMTPRSIKKVLDNLPEQTQAEKYHLYRQYLGCLADFARWKRQPK